MRTDFIFDLETMGANVHRCPVIDMAGTTFSWDRFLEAPYSFEELTSHMQTYKVSVDDQVSNFGCTFSKRDVEWWASQGPEAKSKIKPSSTDLTVREFCDKVLSYLQSEGKIKYWWSRGNTFDPVIIWRLMHETKNENTFDKLLKFYMVRDVRTFIDAKFDFNTKSGFVPVADVDWWNNNFNAHDSTHDVAADVLRLQAIHRAENDLEQVER